MEDEVLFFLFQRKFTHVTRRDRVPWRRPGKTPVKASSSQSVLLEGCTNQCSVTNPLGIVGVFWWIQGAPCLAHLPGKSHLL